MRIITPPKFALTLAQKTLALVMIPLILDIAFLTMLMGIVQEVERSARISEHERELSTQAETVFEHLTEGTLAIGFNRRSHNILGFPAIRAQLDADIEQLSALALENGDTNSADQVKNLANKIVAFLELDKKRHDNGNSYEFPLGYNLPRPQLLAMLARLKQKIDQIHPHRQEKDVNEAAAKSRAKIKSAIIAGVLFNVLLGLTLTIYFNRGASRRLKTLMTNTVLLAEGKELAPPIGGNDEIGNLDTTFHDMARSLKEATEKERAIVNFATDVICSFDANGSCLAINQACKKFWDYEPDELITKNIFSLIPEIQRERFEGELRSIRETNTPGELETTTLKKDGAIIETAWSLYWSEQLSLMIAVIHDVTARKVTEQLKADFTAMVVHDVRSPLATMRMFLDLITCDFYGPTPPAEREQAIKVTRLTDRLLELVNDILSLESMQAGEIPLEKEKVNITKIVDDAVLAVSGAASEVELVTQIESTAPDLEANAEQLTRVLTNLLSNAIKYSPAKEPVTIRVFEESENLILEVTDRGPGIDDAQKALIFEKFRKARSKHQKTGTGLGLTICKQIIERHGGTIGVKDASGGGSVFWVTLPRVKPTSPADVSQESQV